MPLAISLWNGLPQPLTRLAGSDPQPHTPPLAVSGGRGQTKSSSRWLFSAQTTTVHPVPGSWTWDLRDPGRAEWSAKAEAELLFFDPTGHGGARNSEGAGEAAQTAAFLVGVQKLFATSLWIRIGGRILAAATPTGMTAILLFAIGGMSVAHECLTATMRTVKGDCHHEGSSFPFLLVLTFYHILLK